MYQALIEDVAKDDDGTIAKETFFVIAQAKGGIDIPMMFQTLRFALLRYEMLW